nr:ankyrin repeat domain-containing protein [Psychromonas antarctica]
MGLIVKKIAYVITSIVVCVCLYFGTVLYVLDKSHIEDVIICATSDDAYKIPTGFCNLYLVNYRVTKSDVRSLEEGIGIAFLFNLRDENLRYQYLDLFINNGASIDFVNHIDGLSPLLAAVMINDQNLVEYLLAKGADVSKKDNKFELSPVDFINLLSEKEKSRNAEVDRSAILKLLTNHI